METISNDFYSVVPTRRFPARVCVQSRSRKRSGSVLWPRLTWIIRCGDLGYANKTLVQELQESAGKLAFVRGFVPDPQRLCSRLLGVSAAAGLIVCVACVCSPTATSTCTYAGPTTPTCPGRSTLKTRLQASSWAPVSLTSGLFLS